jgi:hypothetical protein
MEKEALPQNAKELIEKTFNGKRGNHSKSLVPHQKSVNQRINLKGVSSSPVEFMCQCSMWPKKAPSRIATWDIGAQFFPQKKVSTKATNVIAMSEATVFANQIAAGEDGIFSA